MEKESIFYSEESKMLIRVPSNWSVHVKKPFVNCKCIDLEKCEIKTIMLNKELLVRSKAATQKQIVLFKQLERTTEILCKKFA